MQPTTNQANLPGAGCHADLHAALFDSDPGQSKLALLSDIEDGLRGLQSALLSHNLEHVAAATVQLALYQAELKRMLLIPSCGPAGKSTSGARQLRTAQWQVLHLGRVQAALLARVQRSLTAMANALAGREASYHPPASVPVSEFSAGVCRCRV